MVFDMRIRGNKGGWEWGAGLWDTKSKATETRVKWWGKLL